MDLGRILVVDDDPMVRDAIRLVLESNGAMVAEAADGESALALLRRTGSFETAIVDLVLPPPSGLRILALLRGIGSRTPFVVVTGRVDNDLRAAVAELRNATVLAKPFGAEELLAAIRAVRADAAAEDAGEPPAEP